jgi:STE24 endopeptidase
MIAFNPVLLGFLFVYIGQTLFEAWLERLNIDYLEKHASVPAGFEELIGAEKLLKINEYTRAQSRLGIAEEAVSDAALLAVLLSGLLPALDSFLSRLGWSIVPAGLLFFLAPAAIMFVIELPFSYHHCFALEEKFGFNRYTLRLWVIDHVKSAVLGLVISGLLLGALLWVIRAAPDSWWFWGFLLVSAFQVLLTLLYPVVIAPLFNKFEPVKDELLAAKIRRLMEDSGIRVKRILQMNAGERSRHTNAYFTGIGRTKQIVLFDTLLESHTHEEILSVLAHEAGHFKKRHVLKQLVLFEGFALCGFYLTYLLIGWPPLYQAFGFAGPKPYAGLFIAGIFWQKAGFFMQPLYMQVSRYFEKQADLFAVDMMRAAHPLAAALKRLASDNLSNLTPHPLYAWFHYSHPPIVRRVATLEEAARTRTTLDPAYMEGLGS